MSPSAEDAGALEDFGFGPLAEAHNYHAAMLREFAPSLLGQVLEVGAGIGQFTRELTRHQTIRRLVSIEPDVRFCARFREQFPQHELIPGTVAQLSERTGWDGVVSVNVLEHIEADEAELATYCELLRQQRGRLCLLVPARQEIYAPIDRDLGHFRRYAKRDLRAKLIAAGFTVERLNYFNSVGYFGWWFTFKALGRRNFDRRSIRLFDRAIFPWVHALEFNVVRPPFGQSLLAVARAG